MKATATAPANIAFIKYWGRKDERLWIPYNGSISMTLSECATTTTVEFDEDLEKDTVEIQTSDGITEYLKSSDGDKNTLVFQHIDRIRKEAGISQKAKVVSKNNFPVAAGLASSASGFAALTMALMKAAGMKMNDTKRFSEYIRLGGSVSAMRSAFGGFTEVVVKDAECFAQQIADENHWDLVDVVAVVSTEKKSISSLEGHKRAPSSPYFESRLQKLPRRLQKCRKALEEKNFSLLGQCIESDTISMHKVMMTSQPPINYFTSGTREIVSKVPKWRTEGIRAYFSIDAGPNVHVICEEGDASMVEKKLREIPEVEQTIINRPTAGVHPISDHLF